MPCSSLVSGKLTTNNCSSRYGNAIDTITPHYMAWYCSAKTCCESFVPSSRQASANYCIGKDGEIWLNVDESMRAWTSSSAANDRRAITIECANYTKTEDGHVYGQLPDRTWDSLVALCVDICRRYKKSRLLYLGSADYSRVGKSDMLLTKHKWFGNTDCPGPWLDNKFSELAKTVTEKLSGVTPVPTPPMVFGGDYECRVSTLNVRDKPTLLSGVVTRYHYGEVVTLDDWYTECDGYVWGRYVGEYSGKYRYVAVGRATGKVEDDDYLIRIG